MARSRGAKPVRRCDVVAALTALLVVMFAIPSSYFIAGVGSIASPTLLLGLLGLLWWFLDRLLYRSGIDRGRQPVRVAALLFVGAVLTSYALFNRDLQPVDWKNAADRGVLMVLALLGILLLAADGVDSIDRLRVLLRRVTFGVALIAIIGIIQYVTKVDIVSPVMRFIPGLTQNDAIAFAGNRSVFSDLQRVSGTAIHPIEFGVVLGMAFPFAAHYALTDRERQGWRRWWQLAVILIAEPMAQSRSGMLVTAVAAIVLLSVWPRRVLFQLLPWVPIAVVAMRVAFPGLIGTITGLFVGFQSDPSYKSRTEDYDQIPQYVSQHIWFGRGFGTFLPKDFFFLDNQYLMSLIDTGVVGLIALAGLLITGIAVALRASRWAITDEERLLARALCGALAGATLAIATFDFFSFQMASVMLFLLIGCAGAMWRLFRAQARAAGYTEPPNRRGPADLDQLTVLRPAPAEA